MKAYILIENNGDNCEYERNDNILYSFNKEKLEELAKKNNEDYLKQGIESTKWEISYSNKRKKELHDEKLKEYNNSINYFNKRQEELTESIAMYIKNGEIEHAENISCLKREEHSFIKPIKPEYLIEDEDTIDLYMVTHPIQRVEEIEIED